MNDFSHIPFLGVGIGLRDELFQETLRRKGEIDVLEVVTENFFPAFPGAEDMLREAAKTFPLIPHGIELSIGSAEDLDMEHLRKVKRVVELIRTPYYSDHFAVSRLGGVPIGQLSPIWFTKESLALVIDKVKRVQDFLGIPVVLENAASLIVFSHADYSEAEFISRVVEQTGCGFHLDITNVHINAYNHKFDPKEFLKDLPLDRVLHLHLAGGEMEDDIYYDTHTQELSGMNAGAWPLFEWALPRMPNVKAIIIERDGNFTHNFEKMFSGDLARTKEIVRKVGIGGKKERGLS